MRIVTGPRESKREAPRPRRLSRSSPSLRELLDLLAAMTPMGKAELAKRRRREHPEDARR
ncbi:MAG TPA: hypothetical protein PLB91_02985 [Spirochaetales bacterium]|nr:hypothetical protein [Spirochaetales bacterium]HRY54690.1 hypothetical protein [Spirochaetia bacterium]HRZ63332.1 hypothetical protein [Spirochaetia bacterium]